MRGEMYLAWSVVVGVMMAGASADAIAESADASAGTPAVAGAPTMDMKAVQERMGQLRKESEARMAQHMEHLKTANPKAFERQKAQMERQQAIQGVVTQFHEGKLEQAAATAQLQPLIKAQVDEELSTVDARIDQLRRQIESLEQMKQDPDRLVMQRIRLLLGEATPSPAPPASSLP